MIDLSTTTREDVGRMWVAALRSGEYEQGKDLLRAGNNTYCCLGVLVDVLVIQWSVPVVVR